MTTKDFKQNNKFSFFKLYIKKNYLLLLPLMSIVVIGSNNDVIAQGYYPPAPQPYSNQQYDGYYEAPHQYYPSNQPQYQTAQPRYQTAQPSSNAALSMNGPSNYRPNNYPAGTYDEDNYTPHAMPQNIYNEVPDADTPAIEMPTGREGKKQIAALQILMSRVGASSGVIDGIAGSNFDKAAAAAGQISGKFIDPNNKAAIEAALRASGGTAFTSYTITNSDVGQFYLASIPTDYSLKAQLPSMAYTSVLEMLSERFHIDERYLQELNPGVNFNQPGITITVPNLALPKRQAISYIIADKARKQVRGYDDKGQLVVAYPSTIGSSDNPSPSGTVEVKRIALNPNYTYNPKINFTQGENNKVLTIPPGPNGPVGTVWIALSKPTYGIHGTPEPSRIGKTSSHGCVRLTNWDAQELAKLIKPGVVVQFID